MNREELCKWFQKKIDSGEILQTGMCKVNGKFEAEPMETLYFYERMMDGDGEVAYHVQETVFTVFELTAEEQKFFDLDGLYFAISESDQGFVYGSELSLTEYEDLVNGDMRDE